MKINPLNAIDSYKTDHRRQYPESTTKTIKTWLHNGECIADLINSLRCDRISIIDLLLPELVVKANRY